MQSLSPGHAREVQSSRPGGCRGPRAQEQGLEEWELPRRSRWGDGRTGQGEERACLQATSCPQGPGPLAGLQLPLERGAGAERRPAAGPVPGSPPRDGGELWKD